MKIRAGSRSARVRSVWHAGTVLGECPRWNAARKRLEFIDVARGELLKYSPADGTRSRRRLADELGFLVIGARGEAVVGAGLSAYVVDETGGGAAALSDRALWTVPGDPSAVRLNDAGIDAAGTVWTGTMDREGRRSCGALYRCTADGSVEQFDEGYTIPNGFAFNRAGDRLYVADSPKRLIYAYEIPSGGRPQVSRETRREWVRVPADHGYPDGMAVDHNDHVWIAFYDGGCVRRYDPDGRIAFELELPARRVTACTFEGGAPGVLYVTSATGGERPGLLQRVRGERAGALFSVRLDAE